jgi:hypothetical protein
MFVLEAVSAGNAALLDWLEFFRGLGSGMNGIR